MVDLAIIAAEPLPRGWPVKLNSVVEAVEELFGDLHRELHHRIPGPRLEAAATKVGEMERHIPALLAAVQAARSPASREEIAKCLALLVVAYPNAGAKADLGGYGQLVVEDVAGLEPSIGAVDRACRELRQSKVFLPAIAEVVEAVRVGEAKLEACAYRLGVLPEFAAKARAALEAEALSRERQARIEAERQARQLAIEQRREINLCMKLGMDVSNIGQPRERVDECLADWHEAHGAEYRPGKRTLGSSHAPKSPVGT